MNKKNLIIIGIIIIVIAIIAANFLFAPSQTQEESKITILNKNTLGVNGTLYIKLTSNGSSLSDKDVKISVLNKDKKVVFNKTAKTHFTGVAVVKLTGIEDGEYTVNATFEGDENYTASSIHKKITIGEGQVEEDLSNVTEIAEDTTLNDEISQDYSSQQSSSSSYSSSSSQSSHSSSSSSGRSSSSSSGSGGSSNSYYDENGKSLEPMIDENGKETYDYY